MTNVLFSVYPKAYQQRLKVMSFRYSCFISYRHGQRALLERIINDLDEALSAELELLLEQEIFLDRKRLEGGDFYNERLASALCESVCMIVVFTPTYFSRTHTYCSREYKAMEKLEEERMEAIGIASDRRRHGLIIPIVFRGATELPEELKKKRLFYDFTEFMLCDTEIGKNPKYAGEICKIAAYIAARYREFSYCADDFLGRCDEFKLPSDEEIGEWLSTVQGSTTAFPGRITST